MEKNEDKKYPKSLTIVLIIFLVLLLLFGGYSMAKSVEVAEPILVVDNNPAIDVTASKNVGRYSFKVKNFNEKGKITESDLKYNIEILSNVDDSIIIELYNNGNKINLNNNKTEYFTISKDKKVEREYTIKITYDKKVDSIIEFSELGDAIYKPVRSYSSGMYSKLAFSITAILETDIILIDEVLSVGDVHFKEKSYNKMKELISDESRTVVIVSHSTNTICELCDKVIWLHDGVIKDQGEPEKIMAEYEEFMKQD